MTEEWSWHYYPWFPKDHLSDVKAQLLTLEEEGAYRRLLDFCWLEDELPNDPEVLAKLCRTTPEKMEEILPKIRELFLINGELISHPRLLDEKRRLQSRRNHRKSAGKKGAESRWDKEENGQATLLPKANDAPRAQSESESSTTNRHVGVDEVFEFWIREREQVVGERPGPQMKATKTRLSKIRARLKEGYTVEQLKEAVLGCMGCQHNVEGGYLDIELICRSQQKVEQFRAQYEKQREAEGDDSKDGDPDWFDDLEAEWGMDGSAEKGASS